jgi:hypothetical protein
VADGASVDGANVLRKPFRRGELLTRVRTILDGPSASDAVRFNDVPGTVPVGASGGGCPGRLEARQDR